MIEVEPKFEGGVWVCPVCGEKFMSKRVAQMHINRNHPHEARSSPSKNGQTLSEKPGVNENRSKDGRAEKAKEKGEEGKKANKKGPKYRKFKIGDTWIKVLKRPEIEIKDHTSWRFWTTANYVASLHKKRVRIKLVNGEEFEGLLKARDPYFVSLVTGDGPIYINKAHILYIKPLGAGEGGG